MNFNIIEIDTKNDNFWFDFQTTNFLTLPHYYSEDRLSVLEKVYKYNLLKLILIDDENLSHGIVFAYKKFRSKKSRLISLPHASYAGIVGSGSLNYSHLEALKCYLNRTSYRSVNFKQLEKLSLPHGDVVRVVERNSTFQFYWESLPSKVRSQANKALMGDFTYSGANANLFEFYKLLAITLKNKGTPSHSFKYWDTLLKTSSGKSRLVTIWQASELLGGGILTETRSYAELECAAFSEKGRRMQIGMVLYAKIIESTFEKKLDFVSLGRSEFNSSVDRFKAQWTKEYYNIRYYSINKLNEINVNSEIKYRKKIYLWISKIIAIAPLPKKFVYFKLPLLRQFLG